MLNELGVQVYLVTGYTDLRRSIDGLAAIVQAQLKLDPYSKALFLFCTSDWRTENSSGRGMKQKQGCLLRSRPDGCWRD